MKAETDSTPVSSYGVVSAGSPMFKVQTSKKGQIYKECDYWTQDQKTKDQININLATLIQGYFAKEICIMKKE